MGPTPMFIPPKGEGCETSVEHGLALWAEPDAGYFRGCLVSGSTVESVKPLWLWKSCCGTPPRACTSDLSQFIWSPHVLASVS